MVRRIYLVSVRATELTEITAARPVRQGPGGPARKPLPIHRTTRSQESQDGPGTGGSGPTKLDPSGLNTDPLVQMRHPMSKPRPRRNSDTSIAAEERRRRDRRKPRETGQTSRRDRPSQTKPSRRLDVIDKLDVTSIYGIGVFHHDGPFDALNPHRNRKLGTKAPMQAFPEGSSNNALGGPTTDPKVFHNQFLGHAGAGAYSDYANGSGQEYNPRMKDPTGSSARHSTFNPMSKADLVHGEETLGLGTSTFLDQTPAPRAAVQNQETGNLAVGGGGMLRKKSIAQRIRGINRDRPSGFHPSGSVTSPEGLCIAAKWTRPEARTRRTHSSTSMGRKRACWSKRGSSRTREISGQTRRIRPERVQ